MDWRAETMEPPWAITDHLGEPAWASKWVFQIRIKRLRRQVPTEFFLGVLSMSAASHGRLSLLLLGLLPLQFTGCQPQSVTQNTPTKITEKVSTHTTPPVERSTVRTDFETSTLRSPRFVNVAELSGIQFVYENGASPKALMVEATGAGCGWLDFDRDGWLDIHFAQGGVPDATDPRSRPPDRLFRNVDGEMFVDVTARSGIDDREYGQGTAVGDFDNDGFDDLLITNVGQNQFYKNQGDGTFQDATETAQLTWRGWSSSAAWADLDRDGDLDLYVCHYVDYDPYHPVPCLNKEGIPSICHPRNAEPTPDECFENLGDGTFRPVAREWGLFGPGNRALGVVVADFSDDGWPDIYVANDTTANFLFINQKGQGFKESAVLLGAAVSMTGGAQASMGIAVNDYDRDGLLDIYLTHFTGEWNTLYRNQGPEGFQDVSPLNGMRDLTLPKLGFGTVMEDFDSDGRMDVFVTNGHIDPQHSDGEGYEMSPQLMTYDRGRWTDRSSTAGDFFRGKYVGRGVAAGDFDRDGDTDLAVGHQNSPAAILRNDSDSGHWLRLKFVCARSNRNGLGTRVVVRQGDQRWVGELVGGASYASANEPVLVFGLGDHDTQCTLEIRWPTGEIQTISNVAVDRVHVLREPTDDQ